MVDRRETIHLATWVAGEIPTSADIDALNIIGDVSYSGHIVGAVNDNGARSIRASDFTHTWNFQSRTGSFTVDSFDGRAYSGLTRVDPITPQSNDFQNDIGANSIVDTATGDHVMRLKGSFFSGPGGHREVQRRQFRHQQRGGHLQGRRHLRGRAPVRP